MRTLFFFPFFSIVFFPFFSIVFFPFAFFIFLSKKNHYFFFSDTLQPQKQRKGPGVDAAWAQSKADELNPAGLRPPLDSEFYSGWLTHWGELMANTSTPVMARSLEAILALPNRVVPLLAPQSVKAIAVTTEAANLALIRRAERGGRADSIGGVNLYMGAGGTNFGFQAGANLAGRAYEPELTSYDYDCPIGEDGALKFFVFLFLAGGGWGGRVFSFGGEGKKLTLLPSIFFFSFSSSFQQTTTVQ